MTLMPFKPSSLPIELALPGEPGQPFTDVLDRLCGGDRRRRERIMVLIQQWDHLADDLGRPPSVEEYAARWGVPVSSAYRLFAEFRDTFPTELDPGRLVGLLWDGLSEPYVTGSSIGSLIGVRVRLAARGDG